MSANEAMRRLTQLHPQDGDVTTMSNELEWNLTNAVAQEVIAALLASGFEASREVNPRDVIEVMVSMAPNVARLNEGIHPLMRKVLSLTQEKGGQVYGGSAVLEDVSGLEPAWYRTTASSRRLAYEFEKVSSYQMVMGVARQGRGETAGEEFAFQLYNFLRKLSPLLVALSASSPYRYKDGQLEDTKTQSQRVGHYQNMSQELPQLMFSTPELNSFADYQTHLQTVSDQLNQHLARQYQLYLAGQPHDANFDELLRDRGDKTYYPFKTLFPHQIYSWIRLRPDHGNTDSVCSIEIRIGDLPLEVRTIEALNSLIAGLAYYAARYGFAALNQAVAEFHLTPQNTNKVLMEASRKGLGTTQKPAPARKLLRELVRLAGLGLKHRGISAKVMEEELARILNKGNDATRIAQFVNQEKASPVELQNFLAQTLATSLARK